MSQVPQRPFPPEFAFLPADSTIPRVPSCPSSGTGDQLSIRANLACVSQTAREVLELLERHVVTMQELGDRLMPLRRATDAAYGLFQADIRPLQDSAPDSHHGFLARSPIGGETMAGGGDLGAVPPEEVVIDEVFRVVRVPELTLGQFAAQVAGTCRSVLGDLSMVILGVDEVITIVGTVEKMFAGLLQRFVVGTEPARPGAETPGHREAPVEVGPTGLSRLWTQAGDRHTMTPQVASYRWLIGVHFFDLATVYCRDALATARAAFEQMDERGGAEALGRAGAYLRGTTAAMWYAGNFSPHVYQSHIRPYIVRPGTSVGLSGAEMVDYKRMKTEKERLAEALVTRYGDEPEAWPPPVLAAVDEFRAAYIDDMEQHVRLASARIGADISLAQKMWQAELQPDLTLRKAVDMLRDMAALRRRAFPF